jgi:hypothetical protein
VIPNSWFLTGVGRSTRGRSGLFWDDGASWAIGQGPGSYCAAWLAGRLLVPGTILPICRLNGWSGSGRRFPKDWDAGWPSRGPTAWDSKDRQVPGLVWTVDWTELG